MQTICKFNGYKSSLTYVVHNMKQVLDALLFIITLVFLVLCLCWIVCVSVLPGLWFAHCFPSAVSVARIISLKCGTSQWFPIKLAAL